MTLSSMEPRMCATSSDLVLTEDEAKTLADEILNVSTSPSVSISIEHTAQSVTRVANGEVLFTNDGESARLTIVVRKGNGFEMVILNQLDRSVAKRAVISMERRLNTRSRPYDNDVVFRDPESRDIPPVHLWKDATVAAMQALSQEGVRETAIGQLLAPLTATPLVGAGVVGLKARSMYLRKRSGLHAYYRETDTLCTLGVRTPDGTSSGWAGQTARDWTQINPSSIASRAFDIAQLARHPMAVEPGRRTVILSATAVGQLLALLASVFRADHVANGMSPLSLSKPRENLFGRLVMDARLTLRSDPDDSDGGFMPFLGDERDPAAWQPAGLPVSAMTWVERGVLTNLAYDPAYAMMKGKQYNRPPFSVRLAPVPGTTTQTVEEMIAACTEGIYVNRFSSVSDLGNSSGMLTGVTRDGCFFVKDGRISKAVKNFRFTESPMFLMNRVDAIGLPERVVVDEGFATVASFPIITPPLMVRDFNFSALSDAI